MTSGGAGELRPVLVAGDVALETAARTWAEDRFDRALLVLGDWTDPLRARARHYLLRDPVSGELRGVAVRFEGFDQPVASLVADDAAAAAALVDAVREDGRILLSVAETQSVPPSFGCGVVGVDPWLVAACRAEPAVDQGVVPIADADELEAFFQRLDMHFFCPEMLRFGHAYGVRNEGGALASAGLVNFVLPQRGYAQIGSFATAMRQRGRGLGSRVLAAIRDSLARAGVHACGVYADAVNPMLPAFYTRRGFQVVGQFRFIRIE